VSAAETVIENNVMQDLFRAADEAAKTDVPVVLFGDAGGRSHLAEYIRQKRGKASLVVEVGMLPLDEQEMLLSKLGALPFFVPPLQGETCPRLPNVDADRTLKAAVVEFKKAYIVRILTETAWNQTKAAKVLGVQRTYLSRLLRELQIRK
jgi:DNA-binding NtrC family response regulator